MEFFTAFIVSSLVFILIGECSTHGKLDELLERTKDTVDIQNHSSLKISKL